VDARAGGALAYTDPVGFGGQHGYYTDVETGMQLLTHRYYDSGRGRFVTRDPIGYNGGINLYGFVGNNPVNDIDPEGTQSPNKDDDNSGLPSDNGPTWNGKTANPAMQNGTPEARKANAMRRSLVSTLWNAAIGVVAPEAKALEALGGIWRAARMARAAKAANSIRLSTTVGSSVVNARVIARYQNILGKKGIRFEVGTPAANKFLGGIGNAAAAYSNKVIYLRTNPSKSEFYEEVIHAFQDIKGTPEEMAAPGYASRMIDRREYEAQMVLASKSRRLGIPKSEYNQTKLRLWRLYHGYEHL